MGNEFARMDGTLVAFLVCWLTLAWLLRRGGRLPMDHPMRVRCTRRRRRASGLGIMAGVAVAGVCWQMRVWRR